MLSTARCDVQGSGAPSGRVSSRVGAAGTPVASPARHHSPAAPARGTRRRTGAAATATSLRTFRGGFDFMKSTTTAANSSPLSSCRKCPPPTIVVCGWPLVPGTRASSTRSAPAVIGIAVAERAQERPVELLEGASRPRGWRPRPDRRGGSGTSMRELACAFLVRLVRERGVVGRDHLGAEARSRSRRSTMRPSGTRAPPARTSARRGTHHPGCCRRSARRYWLQPLGETVRVLADQAQPDQTAPVLTHQRDPGQVEVIEQHGPHPFDVARVGVVAALRRLVRAAEPDEVGGDRRDSRPR